MENQENLEIKFRNKKYSISYKKTKDILFFNDKNGASIAFIRKRANGLSIYVNDKYKKNLEDYTKKIKDEKQREQAEERLRGVNAYTLAPEQIKILIEWLRQ
jgi:hypothetical protein